MKIKLDRVNIMKRIVNQLILLIHEWNVTGQSNERLESRIDLQLTNLQERTGTNREGAINLLLGGADDLSKTKLPTS